MTVGIFLQALAFAVLSGIVASNKNRSVVGWGMLGFLFSFFGFLAAVAVSEVEPEEKSTSSRQSSQPSSTQEFDPDEHDKKCPDCAEYIKLEARVCRYCGYRYSDEEVKRQIEEAKREKESKQEAILATHSFDDGDICEDCGSTRENVQNNQYECPVP